MAPLALLKQYSNIRPDNLLFAPTREQVHHTTVYSVYLSLSAKHSTVWAFLSCHWPKLLTGLSFVGLVGSYVSHVAVRGPRIGSRAVRPVYCFRTKR